MPETAIQTVLSAEEWKLVLALRDIPDSPLRVKISGLLAELMHFIQQPRCLGMQGDGFPCGAPDTSCEECQQMLQVLDEFNLRLESIKLDGQ